MQPLLVMRKLCVPVNILWQGEEEVVVAPGTANITAAGGAMIAILVLGIPGSLTNIHYFSFISSVRTAAWSTVDD